MKKLLNLLLICIFAISFSAAQGNIGISDDPAHVPDPSSMLDIHSQTKGLLIPRMNIAARNSISSPATGLMIYQTNSTPGYYFYNGASWQEVSGGASSLWTESGSNVYRLSGRVGIGTVTPGASLHIDGGAGSKLLIGANSGALSKLTVNAETGSEIVRFRSNGVTKVIIDENGAVGIGVGAPTAKLHVNGSFKLTDGNQSLGKVLTSDGNGLATWEDAIVDDEDWTVSGSNVYRPSGDVGIGTTSPGAALHIKQFGTNIGDGIRLQTSSASGEDWYMYMNIDDDFVFRNDGSSYMTIQKNTGNVAIGTSFATGYRLSIDGKLATEEVLIDMNGFWPDYVFAEDYKLLTIDKFAEYIKKEKHLPGIPSAKEVEENGILSGDMHTRTMEKVEELSLYVIQLHERVKALEEENSRLKSKRKKKKNR